MSTAIADTARACAGRVPRLEQRLAVRERPAAAAIGRQRWNHLLFVHWRVDPQRVQETLPPGLTVDTFAGAAYVGAVPFAMERVRPVGLPPVPGLSWFLELNVRTYVYDENGQPGVWFYSLDCSQPIAVALARRFFHLPYFHARMAARKREGTLGYTCQRRVSGAPRCRYEWTPDDDGTPAAAGSLDFFLLERYVLFAVDGAGRLLHGRVHHAPYRIHQPVLSECSAEPLRQAGFAVEGEPDSVRGAGPVDVALFPLRRVTASPS